MRHDVPEIAHLSNELRRAQQELVQKNLDLESLKTANFQELGKLVHGLRSPASGIFFATEYLMEDGGEYLEQSHRAILQSVLRSSLYMLRMIDDVLTVYKLQSGKLIIDRRATDLVSLVKHCLLLTEHEAARKKVNLQASFDNPTLVAEVDPIKFAQVIDNLVSNAVKFSDKGSSVQIRLSVAQETASISVEDEGRGISKEQLQTIFHPIQNNGNGNGSTTNGTGLGLMISKQIVEGHGGTLVVDSELGQGSTFTVRIPIDATARQARSAAQNA